MRSQEIKDTYIRVGELLEALNDPVKFPCLKHDGTMDVEASEGGIILLKPKTCILKQYKDNDESRQGFFPQNMCPTCRLLFLAAQAEKEMLECVRVEQMREADVAQSNVWVPQPLADMPPRDDLSG